MNNYSELKKIEGIVSRQFKISPEGFKSKSQDADLAECRHWFAWITRKIHGKMIPLAEIGRYLGGRSHATILRSVRYIDGLISVDKNAQILAEKFLSKTQYENENVNLLIDMASGQISNRIIAWKSGIESHLHNIRVTLLQDRVIEGWRRKILEDIIQSLESELGRIGEINEHREVIKNQLIKDLIDTEAKK